MKFAGTDNHRGFLDRLSGIQLKRSLEDIGDMIEAVKNKEAEIFVDIMTE